MSRDVPYDPMAVCSVCGSHGALDMMGDDICPSCAITEVNYDDDEDEDEYEDEDEDEYEDEDYQCIQSLSELRVERGEL